MFRFSMPAHFGKKIFVGLALTISLCVAAGTASAVEFDVKGTTVTLGGYIKAMALYDIDGNVDGSIPNGMGDEINAYGVPLDGAANADEDRFSMTARESRLFLKTPDEHHTGFPLHLSGRGLQL